MIRSIAISLCCLAVMAGPALSQNVSSHDVRLRIGAGADSIAAAGDYEVRVFARRLGHVSAMARHADGTIYTADRHSGRIFRIQDRRMDGAADITQPLPHRFDRPTGLAVAGDIIFVADQGGLWRVQPGGGTPALIAPFANSGSNGEAHPITMIAPTTLLLGLSKADGTAQLLEVDTLSGHATRRAETRGQIIGFATASPSNGVSTPWILLRRDDKTFFGSSLQTVRDIGLDARAVWINEATARAHIALPDGVYATIATFAGLKDKGTLILGGFHAEASPGAIMSDERGVFVADQAGGHIWRLLPKPPVVTPSPAPTAPDIDPVKDRPSDLALDRSTRPELVRGSGISNASTIGPASTMPAASTLPAADQPRAASDPKE